MKFTVIFLAAIMTSSAVGGEGPSVTQGESVAEAQVAQLLIVGIDGEYPTPELRSFVHDWNVGGIILYAYNVSSADQVRRLTTSIHDLSPESPPFIAIDQEGGIVRRFHDQVPVIPSAMAIGATRSTVLAHAAGEAVGSSLRRLGITMNLAPDLDILTNPVNGAIGTRSFGDDPHLVASLGSAFLDGETSAGIIGVVKHFPGEGAVAEDPHQFLPILTASRLLLAQRELVPFAAAIHAGARAVMVGHVAVEAYDSANPASVSPVLMNDLLRKQMHFQGLIITDALQMKALHPDRSAGELALEAVRAGADMVITVGSATERVAVVRFLASAYRDGRLPHARVEGSLVRIRALKKWLRERGPSTETKGDIIRLIARQSVTTFGAALPANSSEGPCLFIGPSGLLSRNVAHSQQVLLDLRPDAATVRVEALAMAGHPVRLSLVVAAASNEAQFAAVQLVHATVPDVPFVFVNLGSPYRVIAGPSETTIFTYSDSAESQVAAGDVIKGDLVYANGQTPRESERSRAHSLPGSTSTKLR